MLKFRKLSVLVSVSYSVVTHFLPAVPLHDRRKVACRRLDEGPIGQGDWSDRGQPTSVNRRDRAIGGADPLPHGEQSVALAQRTHEIPIAVRQMNLREPWIGVNVNPSSWPIVVFSPDWHGAV